MTLGPLALDGLAPTNVGLTQYDLATPGEQLQLYWPSAYFDTDFVCGNDVWITCTAAGCGLILPSAIQVSVGQVVVVKNVGSIAFTLYAYGSVPIVVIEAGTALYCVLIDSSTEAGTWDTTALSQTTSVNAQALAGDGLVALPSPIAPFPYVLNTNAPLRTENSNFSVSDSDRSHVIIMTSSCTASLPTTLPEPGFFCTFLNTSSLSCTILAGSGTTINGSSSYVLPSTSSVRIVSNGTNLWYVIDQAVNTITGGGTALIDVSAGGDIPVTANTLLNRNLFLYGALTADVTLQFFPLDSSWNIYNGTTEAFNVNAVMYDFTTSTELGATYALPQTQSIALFGVTATEGGVAPSLFLVPDVLSDTTFPNGSVGAPSITFTNALTSGFYLASEAPPEIGLSINGSEVTTWNENLVFITPALECAVSVTSQLYLSGDGSEVNPSYSFSNYLGSGFSAEGGLTTPGAVRLSSNGIQIAKFTTSFVEIDRQIRAYPLGSGGSAAVPAYSFYQSNGSGMYSDVVNTVSFSCNTTPALTLNSTSVKPLLPLYAIDGSAATPSFTFASAPNLGFYQQSTTALAISVGGVGIGNFNPFGLTLSGKVVAGSGTSASPSYTFLSNPGTGLSYNGSGNTALQSSLNSNLIQSLAPLANSSPQPLTTNNGGLGSATVTPTAAYVPVATGATSTAGSQTVWRPGVFGYVYTPILTVTSPADSFSFNASYTKLYASTRLVVSTAFFWGASYGAALTRFGYSVDGGALVIINPSVIVRDTQPDVLRETAYTISLSGLAAGSHSIAFSITSAAGSNPCCLNRSYDGSQTNARSFISIMEVGG